MSISQARVTVDDDAFPLVVTSIEGRPSMEAWQRMMRAWDDVYARGTPHVTISLTIGFGQPPDAAVRRAISDWTLSRKPLGDALTKCNQFVATNPVYRGVVLAFDWVVKPLVPREIVGSYEEALASCVRACRDHRIDADIEKMNATSLRYGVLGASPKR